MVVPPFFSEQMLVQSDRTVGHENDEVKSEKLALALKKRSRIVIVRPQSLKQRQFGVGMPASSTQKGKRCRAEFSH